MHHPCDIIDAKRLLYQIGVVEADEPIRPFRAATPEGELPEGQEEATMKCLRKGEGLA